MFVYRNEPCAQWRQPFIYPSKQVWIGWHRTGTCYTDKLTFSHGSSIKVWGVYYTNMRIIFKFLRYICDTHNRNSNTDATIMFWTSVDLLQAYKAVGPIKIYILHGICSTANHINSLSAVWQRMLIHSQYLSDQLLGTVLVSDVISELVMVRDGVLAFTDSHFSTADACSFMEFLCTVRGLMFFYVLWVRINNNNN